MPRPAKRRHAAAAATTPQPISSFTRVSKSHAASDPSQKKVQVEVQLPVSRKRTAASFEEREQEPSLARRTVSFPPSSSDEDDEANEEKQQQQRQQGEEGERAKNASGGVGAREASAPEGVCPFTGLGASSSSVAAPADRETKRGEEEAAAAGPVTA